MNAHDLKKSHTEIVTPALKAPVSLLQEIVNYFLHFFSESI